MGLNRNLGNIPEVITELSGNIGIGASVPKEKLEVAGLVGNIRIYGRSGIAQNQITSNVYYNGSSWVRDTSAGAVAINLNSSDGVITFNTTSATSGFPDERIRITSGGNVGIGETNPFYKLDVKSAGYNVANFNSTYGQVSISFANSGNIFAQMGSGTSVTPTATFDDLGFGTAGLNKNIVFATGTAYTERMRITPGGNVLIGTATDNGTKLQVSGSISASGQLLRYSGNISSGQTISFSLNDEGFGMRLFMISAFNNANANANRMGLFMVNTRNLNYGGGNSILTLGTAQNTTGTSGEISSLSYSIGGSGTALTLNVTASIVSGSGSIQIRVQEVKWVG